jgi:hypothetical protein
MLRHYKFRTRTLAALASCVLVLLSGCATNIQGGIGPLASPKAAQIVDLVEELHARAWRLEFDLSDEQKSRVPSITFNISPECRSGERGPELIGDGRKEDNLWKSSSIPSSAQLEVNCMIKAQNAFNYAMSKINDEKVKARERNGVQDRLITASEQSCTLYKRYLNARQSSTNFLLGATTTAFAAVATAVTSAGAAKNYTTGALLSSSLSAEWNADMFNSNLVFVISKAIDKERESVLRTIYRDRSADKYEDYPVEAAIGQALTYHDVCSLYRGMQVLDNSITVARDPGLKHLASLFPEGSFKIKDGKFSATDVDVSGSNDSSSIPSAAGNARNISRINPTDQTAEDRYWKELTDLEITLEKARRDTKGMGLQLTERKEKLDKDRVSIIKTSCGSNYTDTINLCSTTNTSALNAWKDLSSKTTSLAITSDTLQVTQTTLDDGTSSCSTTTALGVDALVGEPKAQKICKPDAYLSLLKCVSAVCGKTGLETAKTLSQNLRMTRQKLTSLTASKGKGSTELEDAILQFNEADNANSTFVRFRLQPASERYRQEIKELMDKAREAMALK